MFHRYGGPPSPVAWILSISFCLTCLATTAPAHPHAFVTQRLAVVFDHEGLAGIRVRWTFDEMFASLIADAHDRNKNGTLEADEIVSVKGDAFDYIAEESYFVFIDIDEHPFPVKFIRDFKATLKNGRLDYEFLIPCHVTAIHTAKRITIATYDPSYYTAIFFADKNPVTLIDADGFDVQTQIREDPDTAYYFDMIHPWTLFLSFSKEN